MRTKLTNENGSSLIDVLIANVLLILGAMTVLGPMTVAMRQMNDADRVSIAMNLARGEMEEVLNQGYAEVVASEEGFGSIDGYPDFRKVVVVQDDTPVPHVKTVRVAILWKVPGGNESTQDGIPYDPLAPDTHRAFVELITLKESS